MLLSSLANTRPSQNDVSKLATGSPARSAHQSSSMRFADVSLSSVDRRRDESPAVDDDVDADAGDDDEPVVDVVDADVVAADESDDDVPPIWYVRINVHTSPSASFLFESRKSVGPMLTSFKFSSFFMKSKQTSKLFMASNVVLRARATSVQTRRHRLSRSLGRALQHARNLLLRQLSGGSVRDEPRLATTSALERVSNQNAYLSNACRCSPS